MKHLIIAGVAAFSLVGCMSVRLAGLERTSDPIVEETHHGNGWARKSWSDNWNEEKASDRTLGSVIVGYDYIDALMAVFSFGLYMPLDVSYRLNARGAEGVVKKNE